jgi:hypothetical protein
MGLELPPKGSFFWVSSFGSVSSAIAGLSDRRAREVSLAGLMETNAVVDGVTILVLATGVEDAVACLLFRGDFDLCSLDASSLTTDDLDRFVGVLAAGAAWSASLVGWDMVWIVDRGERQAMGGLCNNKSKSNRFLWSV